MFKLSLKLFFKKCLLNKKNTFWSAYPLLTETVSGILVVAYVQLTIQNIVLGLHTLLITTTRSKENDLKHARIMSYLE